MMNELSKMLLVWWGVTGLAAVVMTVLDKCQARRGGHRVPERILLLTGLVGGAAAMLVTMRLIRHKTLHRRFMWGLPAMLVLQAAVVVGMWYMGWLIA